MSLRVALDVEGVLSDTHSITTERSDKLEPWMNEQWGFPDDLYDEFMHVSNNLWHNHYEEIPPQSDNIGEASDKLIDAGYKVDIVTHRHNQDEQVKAWLDMHDVHYRHFLTPSCSKIECDYDIYVDDKPALAEKVAQRDDKWMVIIDQQYNRDVPYSEHVERATDAYSASLVLSDPYVMEDLEARLG